MDERLIRFTVQVIALSLLFSLESFFPLIQLQGNRFRHALRNLSLGILNAFIIFVFFSSLTLHTIHWTQENQAGLLNQFNLSFAMKSIFAFILFDLWMYLWHVANHKVPFFWRFHRVHHADLEMDCTTALRFHRGEIVLSSLARLCIIPLIGMDYFIYLFFYEFCLQPVILLHHSNIALPEKWDKILRALLVSPNMHRIHHSQVREETNSTYASIFSFWDRMGRTFRKREENRILNYGLPEIQGNDWQNFLGMLKIPFVNFSAVERQNEK